MGQDKAASKEAPSGSRCSTLWFAIMVGLLGWLPVSVLAIDTIAFGSCARQQMPQPIWAGIMARSPDLFIFMGDNVYADTQDMTEMRAAYAELAAKPGFAALRAEVPMVATWDDHDYGANDAGAEFPAKAESQQVFLDFFAVPDDDPRRQRPGVYSSRIFGETGQRVQVILLDTRYFRSAPKMRPAWQRPTQGRYAPNTEPQATMLGEAQWQWLEKRLRRPAELRLIVSSIQVLPTEHRFEKWANFPLERRRLLRLIAETEANGVLLLSGDRHLGEISRLPVEASLSPGYPLYEVTASGMNSAGAGAGEQNRLRVLADNVRRDHFGLLHIDWQAGELTLSLADVEGDPLAQHRIGLDALRREE